MKEIDCFIIHGSKDLIFRRESEDFIFFDPYDLEFYRVDFIGAEILYLISKKVTFKELLDYFVTTYELTPNSAKHEILYFLNTFPLLKIIYSNLISLDIPLGDKYIC